MTPASRWGTSRASSRACGSGGDVVRRLAATPLLGRWSVDLDLAGRRLHGRRRAGRRGGQRRRGCPARAFTVDTTRAGRTGRERVGVRAHSDVARNRGGGCDGEVRRASVVAADGAWVLTFDDVPDGTHTYAVTATDAAGNDSAATTVTVVVDTVGPMVQIATAPPRLSACARHVRVLLGAGSDVRVPARGHVGGVLVTVEAAVARRRRLHVPGACDGRGGERRRRGERDVHRRRHTARGTGHHRRRRRPRHQVDLSGTAEPGATIVDLRGRAAGAGTGC